MLKQVQHDGERFRESPILWGSAATILLALVALATPINHDESQYVAAALLGDLRPYADFLTLQTPLQIVPSAFIARLFSDHAFIALRLATALLGLVTLACTYASMRMLSVPRTKALTASAMLLLCHSFGFGFAVVRNDALPTALLSLGMMIALIAAERGRLLDWGLAGLLLAAAASAKISFMVPLALLPLFLLIPPHRRILPLLAYAGGGVIGLLPALLARAAAPEAFDWAVFGFGSSAPMAWYGATGHGWRLGLPAKLLDSLLVLARGPALIALIVVLIDRKRAPRARGPLLLLDLLVIAGLVALLLPTPTQKQYALPMLPPLFVRLATIEWSRLARRGYWLFAIVGLGQPIFILGQALSQRSLPAIELDREAHWIGSVVHQGFVATLSPHYLAGSGRAPDRRFATGPFVYRTGDMLSEDQLRSLHAISRNTLGRFLDADPPAAILTGHENGHGFDRVDLDEGLQNWADTRHYRLVRSPSGVTQLYLRP